MAIDFTRSFAPKAAPIASNSAADRPKANFWLNVGYSVPVAYTNPDGTVSNETKFVSLPVGIPLDTMEKLSINSRNVEYASLQGARNDLFDQIMAVASKMAAGEEQILNLELQLRRINDDAKPIAAAENVFVRQIDLVGAVD